MKLFAKRATAVFGAVALTAAAAPAAHAQVLPTAGPGAGLPAASGVGVSPCATTVTGLIGGSPGTPLISVCQAPGALSFIGPTIGQIATTIGPITIGPAVVGQQVVSAGPVVTPLP
jgi:hypothetical protein